MFRNICVNALIFVLSSQLTGWSQEKPAVSAKDVPDGVYRVLREGASEKEVQPLQEGEAIVSDYSRYLKREANDPIRYFVVADTPDVPLKLARAPVVSADDAGPRILVKLTAKSGSALEKVTRDNQGGKLTIVIKGEVVTTHKIRDVITGGDIQITSCVAGAAEYLLEQLRSLHNHR